MVIRPLNKKLIDVFLDMNTFPTGFEESCWLRLQLRGTTWLQVAGIKIPTWKFKQITESIPK